MTDRSWFEKHANSHGKRWDYFNTADDAYHRRRIQEATSGLEIFLKPSARVLDIGAGTGAMSEALLRLGFNVTSLDHVRASSALLPALVLGDCLRMPYRDNSFDAAALCELIYYFKPNEQVELLAEVRRVLKPDGLVLISQRKALRQPPVPLADLGIDDIEICAKWWTLGKPERILKLPVYIFSSSTRAKRLLNDAPNGVRSVIEGTLVALTSTRADAAMSMLGNAARRVLPAALLRSTQNTIYRAG